jgi:hypothetical protein
MAIPQCVSIPARREDFPRLPRLRLCRAVKYPGWEIGGFRAAFSAAVRGVGRLERTPGEAVRKRR